MGFRGHEPVDNRKAWFLYNKEETMLRKLSNHDKTHRGVQERQAYIDRCLVDCIDLCRELLHSEATMNFNIRAY